MAEHVGRRLWAIAEGYIPGPGAGSTPALEGHETACILNPNDTPAAVEIILYFEDREPVGPYRLSVPARRTRHVRFNDLADPAPVPRETPYSCLIRASVPVVVQHTRLDSRLPPHALLSTIAWSD